MPGRAKLWAAAAEGTTVGTIKTGSPDSAEAKELAALFDEHDANYRKLRAIREDALRDHYGEFVIVTGWGNRVRYDSTMDALLAAVPDDERRAAAHDFLVERPANLIL